MGNNLVPRRSTGLGHTHADLAFALVYMSKDHSFAAYFLHNPLLRERKTATLPYCFNQVPGLVFPGIDSIPWSIR